MRVLAACALAMLSLATVSSADPIDFDSDPLGSKPQGWTSDDSPIVHFYDTNPLIPPSNNGLVVVQVGVGNNALGVLTNTDLSGLVMNFDQHMNALSFQFGNDDPALIGPGDVAVLKVFNGLTLVGMTVIPLNNPNMLIDESIGIVAPNFDNALFYYGNSNLLPFTRDGLRVGLIEVVDNINYRVPEPSLLALSGLGALVVAWRRRRKAA
ncbi:MAG: PEP-CTERM sorting domain-containing protein [Planctomycetota bacterium]